MDRCKHGLIVASCWLCKGGKQSEDSKCGPPVWMVNSTQMAINTQYGANLSRPRLTSNEYDEHMSSGSRNPNNKTSLPYRTRAQDPKTRKRYDILNRKK